MQKTDFHFDKIEREFFVVLNNANRKKICSAHAHTFECPNHQETMYTKLHPNQNS